jgi:hypothetical protein
MALLITAIARQWLSSDHVVTLTDTNNNRRAVGSGVFCAVRAEAIYIYIYIYNEDQLWQYDRSSD